MPPTPTQPVWTISAHDVNGGSNGSLLVGCHITKNAAGTAYQFTQPNINNVLSTDGPPLPTVPFTFPSFTYQGFTWTIVVNSLGVGADIDGTWATAATPEIDGVPAQQGDYTAQTGGGPMGADEAASSAKA